MTILNITDQLPLVDATPLDPHFLAINAQEAAAAFIAAGTAANTVRSYRSALTYWSAWLQQRHGQALAAWLDAAPTESGQLFRRVYRGGRVGTARLSPD